MVTDTDFQHFILSKLCATRSAFFLYSNDERAKVRAEHPTYGVGQVAKQLAEQWRNVSASTKAKYDKEAVEDKKRYEKVCQCIWMRPIGSEIPHHKKIYDFENKNKNTKTIQCGKSDYTRYTD